MHYLIAGAGPAAIAAAERLRKLDSDGEITLIGAQPQPPYSRMAIPYFLTGKVGEDGTYLRRSSDHYKDQRIELVRGEVVCVDASAHQVTLADGQQFNYDKLLLATGAEPIIPPVPGMDDPGCSSVGTWKMQRRL